MTKRAYSVAIDGPSGAGKSTIARRCAQALGFVYVDTGAIYRTVAFAAMKQGVALTDEAAVAEFLPKPRIRLDWCEGEQHMYVDGEDVTSALRGQRISKAASTVAAYPSVRQFLLETQRALACTRCVVMDGRDIGTVVLPEADVKIFLSASPEIRAKRRWLELQARGAGDALETVLRDVLERDARDMNREIAPLKQAQDAILLDTTEMTLEESIAAALKIICERLGL